jgi:hypothetical protein
MAFDILAVLHLGIGVEVPGSSSFILCYAEGVK